MLIKKSFCILLAVFLLESLIMLASCGENKADNAANITASISDNGKTSFPYTFTDSTGKSITLEQNPKKTAVLFSSYAEVWQLAGGTIDISVGDSIERGFADKSCILVDKTTGHSSIDNETLVNEAPDFVIGTTDFDVQKKTAEFCRGKDIPAALFKVETFDDYLNMLKIFTDITGNSNAYVSNRTAIKQNIDTLLNKIDSSKKNTSVLFVRAGTGAKSTKAKSSDDNFVCKMLSQIGTINVADTAKTLLDGLSDEAVLLANPEYIFVTTMGNEESAKNYFNSVLQGDVWKNLDAVKQKKVIFLPKELFHYKPNAKWNKAYEYLINSIYGGDEN